MPGIKLRSEKLEKFDALGERGQPVYKVAPQILAVLQRHEVQYPGISKHFAIPQASADGSLVDWYAPTDGDVIPWMAASTEERSHAHAKLLATQQSVEQIRAQTLNATKGETGDGALFAKLLAWIIHHPDASYIYLVDRQPVITFWGFLNNGANRTLDPLHALAQVIPPLPVPMALPSSQVALAPPAVSPPPERVTAAPPMAKRKMFWWRRWWFWLGLTLLLSSLLLGLRACAPHALPFRLGATDTSLATHAPITANTSVSTTPMRGDLSNLSPPPDASGSFNLPAGVGTRSLDGDGQATGDVAAKLDPVLPPLDDLTATPGTAPVLPSTATTTPASNPTPAIGTPTPTVPPALSTSGDNQARPDTTGNAGTTAATSPSLPGTPLAIPAGAKDGKADFLNGRWGAGAGIQDRNTGAPLRLQYAFEKGQGTVNLSRHDGVQCSAPVTAKLKSGSLSITNTAQASCTDASTYALPEVICEPNAQNAADCVGHYGDERFPMTMRQTNH